MAIVDSIINTLGNIPVSVDTLLSITLVGMLIFGIAAINTMNRYGDFNDLWFYAYIVGAVVMFGSLMCAVSRDYVLDEEKRTEAKQQIEAGYNVYVNGTEVDASTINLESYDDIVINHEGKSIIITVN